MDDHGFYVKLAAAVERNNSLLCVGLDPSLDRMPDRFRNGGDPVSDILTWNRAVIDATSDLACVYKPNIAFYEALGEPGYKLLRQTLDHIPAHIPVILDAKRGDIASTAEAYAKACFEHWQVDAITASPYLGRDSLLPFTAYAGKGIFVLCHTSNPGAADFQELEISDWRNLDREPNQPLYIHIARTAIGISDQIGLVVSATFPETIAGVRNVAPHTWFLIPGVGSQAGDLESTVRAGLRADGAGLVLNVSRGIASADDSRKVAQEIRDRINRIRTNQNSTVHSLGTAERGPAIQTVRESHRLARGLAEVGAIKFGDFTLTSGKRSSYYTDMRLLVSRPSLLDLAASAYADLLKSLECDRIAGVPYGALPIGTAVALKSGVPLIYPRKEAKTHGTGRQIEGEWKSGEKVVVIEDVVTSGGSLANAVELLRDAGLVVEDAIVLLDREEGAIANLQEAGVRVHAVFTVTQLVTLLQELEILADDLADDILKNVHH